MNPHTSEAIARGIVDVARKGRNIGAGVGAGLGGAVGLAHGLKKDEKGKRHVGRGALHGAIGAAGGGVLGAGAGGVGGFAAGLHKHMPDIERAAEEAVRDAHHSAGGAGWMPPGVKFGSAGYSEAVQAGFLDELEKIADATSYAKGKGLARVKELLTGSHAEKLKERNFHIFDRLKALRRSGNTNANDPIREALGRAGTVRKDARELEKLKVLGARAGGVAAAAGGLGAAGAGAHHALKKREST
jgi:hypothetical protein